MDTTLTIKGMHCDACKSLIRLELEDISLDSKIELLDVLTNQNQGILKLRDVTADEITQITKVINAMDQYAVA